MAGETEGDSVALGDTKVADLASCDTLVAAIDASAGAPAELAAGSHLERFTIVEKLGEGGMGVVYTAFDPELDRVVAIKLLRSQSDSEGPARLRREAQAMARLTHPNVVSVHDVSATSDGNVFVCMEFVRGTTLRHEVRRLREKNAQSWREIVSRYVDAGRGLAAAHQSGLVHRDFKPDNVLVDRTGCVKVGDFGLASLMGQQAKAAREQSQEASLAGDTPLSRPITTAGSVLGTPAYMAPEQHRGETADHRADQFAYCVSLYEALYGELPFPGRTREQYLANILSESVRKPPPTTTVPGWVHRAILRGLKPDPADRYPSMEQLLSDIHFDPQDERVGVRTRFFLAIVAGALFTMTPLILQLANSARTIADYAASDLVVLVLVALLSYWARESLFKSAYNRAFALAVLFTLAAHLPLILCAHLLGLSASALGALHVFLWFVASGLTSLILEPRFAWTAAGYLGAFLVISAWPQYELPAVTLGSLVLTLNAVILWAPHARGASPHHHHKKAAS